jgi:hypothetical protein
LLLVGCLSIRSNSDDFEPSIPAPKSNVTIPFVTKNATCNIEAEVVSSAVELSNSLDELCNHEICRMQIRLHPNSYLINWRARPKH